MSTSTVVPKRAPDGKFYRNGDTTTQAFRTRKTCVEAIAYDRRTYAERVEEAERERRRR